jgi:hypothetical protein
MDPEQSMKDTNRDTDETHSVAAALEADPPPSVVMSSTDAPMVNRMTENTTAASPASLQGTPTAAYQGTERTSWDIVLLENEDSLPAPWKSLTIVLHECLFDLLPRSRSHG